VRNSLLVEQFGADNERESSIEPKLRIDLLLGCGQFSNCLQSDSMSVVGERSYQHRSHRVTSGGAITSDYAGMSNDKPGENPGRRKPKVSWGR
jgi:hypothetical protein